MVEHEAPVEEASSGQMHPLGLPAGPAPEERKALRTVCSLNPEQFPPPPQDGYFPPLLTRVPRARNPPAGSRTTAWPTEFERGLGIYSELGCLGYGRLSEGGAQWRPPLLSLLLPAPFSFSPASANICNVVLMRYGELEEGIDVLDGDGNLVGSSKIAARHVGCPGAQGAGDGVAPGRVFVSPRHFDCSGATFGSTLASFT